MTRYKRFLVFVLLILVFSGKAFTQDKDDIYEKINKNLEIFGEVYKEILLNYVDRINSDKFFEAGINGMLATLDPYTVFYSANDRQSIDLITSGKYGGIGISVTAYDSIVMITDVMNGYEAQRKGLRAGDILKKIDDLDVDAGNIEQVRKKVRGNVGTKLFVTIERNGQTITFELTRQEIILKDISYYGFLNNDIAYIKLDRFGNNSDKEFDITLRTLKSQKEIKGLIIDLRNNGGGYLNAAINMLNKFTAKSTLLLTTKNSKLENPVKYFSKEEPIIGSDVPIAVIINQGTASASEIMAGAIQDLDRGVIIGTKSFGKGLVQNIKDLNFDTHLKVTTSRYFTPSGRWIQSKDYFLENKGGVFLGTEEFRQKEFKTLHGRTVFASGGITPDVEVKTESESRLHLALVSKDLFFQYAEQYVASHQGMKVFTADDNTFTDFKNFIETKGFNYVSDTEKKLNELKKTSSDNNLNEKISGYINSIEAVINQEEAAEYDKAKNEILRTIEKEINRMISEEKEQIEAGFSKDAQLQEAIRILSDKTEYNRLLGL